MTGYKIISTRNNGSFLVNKSEKGHVSYKIGELTKPNKACGPLTVFTTFDAASDFCGHSDVCGRIFKVQYTPSYSKILWQPMWKYPRKQGMHVTISRHFPYGTVLADDIKPIEWMPQTLMAPHKQMKTT